MKVSIPNNLSPCPSSSPPNLPFRKKEKKIAMIGEGREEKFTKMHIKIPLSEQLVVRLVVSVPSIKAVTFKSKLFFLKALENNFSIL